ncbi:MAG: hypothetical protein AB7O43_05060 [Hyphomicrobiaceae bacterium]
MAQEASKYDRAAEDVGNIVSLEHVNTEIPDQRLGTLYYIAGLGLTRDPYQVVSVTNMWANVGRCQFHLPTGRAQVLHGHTALVMPGRESLLQRLKAVSKPLEGTRFAFRELNECVETISPWGNRIRCFEPGPRFGKMMLGMPYVELEVERGTAEGIARFYAEIFSVPTGVDAGAEGKAAVVSIGTDQSLVFRETDGPHPAFDGYHVAVYLANFSMPYRALLPRGLISRETNQHEYRFTDIVDPDTGRVLTRLEHEVRSMRHPQYARPLVNRNPETMGMAYTPGNEQMSWALPAAVG